MKKLFIFSALITLALGGGSCSDSETDEFQNILIPQDNLSASISADALSHTIGFETTQSWTASVRETSRAESWISINPTSGDAGKHTITVTLTENETTESRQAVVIISCGGESANISITQRGVGQDEPEDPDNPNNPDNPQKPEHPDVAPEDRLTWVETTYTEVYSDGSSTDKSYMLFEYDAEGLLTGYDQYDYDSEQTDKINASYEGTLKRSEGKITDEEKWFEIGGSSYEGMPLPNSGEYTKEYRLNASGLVSGYTDPDGASQTFTYNADGTQARLEYRNPSYPDENSTSTLTWQDGNIVSISTIDGRDNETTTFSYTEHLNPWNGIDIGAFMIGDAEESAMLLGISGTTVKNLPASCQDGNSTTTYTYTFDAEGRVSTIVIEENWQDGGGSGSERTEYTLHYGPQTVSKPDYIPYLAKQEVVDEGTLPYIFWEDNPDEKQYGVNAYTSYAKIRSTMSDGRTSEKTEYRQININPSTQEGPVLGYLYITQDEADNFRLVSTSFNEIPLGENEINPHRFVYTLEYNCFTVNLEFDVFYPSCTVFDPATGEQKTHWMPMLPLDKNCFTVSEPELRYMGENTDENGPTSEYEFTQKYLFRVNPDVEPAEYDYQQLNRFIYVAHY